MKNFQKISAVYKITNKINGKFYIGSSTNIKQRWNSHKERYNNPNCKEYNKPLYEDMRKYGINNFVFRIICKEDNESLLREKENKIIKATNAERIGYNTSIKAQKHPNHKLFLDDVILIRELRSNNESMQKTFEKFKDRISYSGFCKIWKYETWNEILLDKKDQYKPNYSNPGDKNPRAKLTNSEVSFIRKQKKLGKSQKEIYKLFSDKLTPGSFKNIWYGYNWKSLT